MYFYLYTQIVADSCEWLISCADKYVWLRPLRWILKPLATAPLEQESEYPGSGVVLDCIDSLSLPSFLLLTIFFLVPDDVLKMPLAYWP